MEAETRLSDVFYLIAPTVRVEIGNEKSASAFLSAWSAFIHAGHTPGPIQIPTPGFKKPWTSPWTIWNSRGRRTRILRCRGPVPALSSMFGELEFATGLEWRIAPLWPSKILRCRVCGRSIHVRGDDGFNNRNACSGLASDWKPLSFPMLFFYEPS